MSKSFSAKIVKIGDFALLVNFYFHFIGPKIRKFSINCNFLILVIKIYFENKNLIKLFILGYK